MIYCKKIDEQYSDIEITGDNYTVTDEIATVLMAVHGEYLKHDPQDAPLFRSFIRKMAEDGSVVWQIEGKDPETGPCEPALDTTAAHYERLCRAAAHFGLDAQKQKTKEEMGELAELLGDYSVPDRALRAARIEEIADVYNMLDQLCILWNCEDEVQDVAERKMIRTMERIESGYYDEG